jgi:predicted transcriptional regulator
MTSISITIKGSNATKLERLAEAMDRSRSWVVNDAGAKLTPHEEVFARLDAETKVPRK